VNDRKKEVLNSGTLKVSCAQVEHLLCKYHVLFENWTLIIETLLVNLNGNIIQREQRQTLHIALI